MVSFVGLWSGKSFLNTNDFSQEEVKKILDAADVLRKLFRTHKKHEYLPGKTLFMMFYNRSLRTRNSFEAGMYQLGGNAHFLSPQDVYTPALPEDMVAYQTEAVSDVARVLSRYGDAIAIRIYGDAAKWVIGRGHKVVQEFAKHATIPVLNMEDDMYHPFQALADVQAMRSAIPKLKGKKLVVSYAYSGGLKPLAVPQNEALIGTQMGMDVVLAHPPGFELEDVVTQACKANADRYGGGFRVVNDMKEAFEGADVVYPKAWSPKNYFPPHNGSLDKNGATAYQDKFKDWICTQEMMDLTNKGKYMHCGPADRGQEVTDDVIDNKDYSLYFEEAEDRLHVQKAVMCMVMGGRPSKRRK
ncbi:MAG: ornithine carbamoyltransferase [Candidatus Bathyarchaeia archaeon]